MQFRISPESFMQINTKAADIIYRSTLEHAQIDENTILLDIGSGIGAECRRPLSLTFEIYLKVSIL